jgi:hypothetical protein
VRNVALFWGENDDKITSPKKTFKTFFVLKNYPCSVSNWSVKSRKGRLCKFVWKRMTKKLKLWFTNFKKDHIFSEQLRNHCAGKCRFESFGKSTKIVFSFFSWVSIKGCQVVCFQTKNPNLGKFWRALDWKKWIYFTVIRNILRIFGNF